MKIKVYVQNLSITLKKIVKKTVSKTDESGNKVIRL